MLQLENVNISYGRKTVLNNVSFTADYGTITGLLGLNGAGKSSLLTAVAGLSKQVSGSLTLDGISFKENPAEYRKNFGYVTQENALIPELSALDNLRLWSPESKEAIFARLSNPPLSLLNVHNFIYTSVRSMSGGMKKRLQLATVLINSPKVLLLDEPLAALDMVAREDILNYIISYKMSGGMVIIASHDESVFGIADKILYTDNNQCVNLAPGTDYKQLLRRSLQ